MGLSLSASIRRTIKKNPRGIERIITSAASEDKGEDHGESFHFRSEESNPGSGVSSGGIIDARGARRG
jgi:hypothetical protein